MHHTNDFVLSYSLITMHVNFAKTAIHTSLQFLHSAAAACILRVLQLVTDRRTDLRTELLVTISRPRLPAAMG